MIDRVRRGYELKSLFFGRPIRPFHLAVTIATLVVAVSNLFAHQDATFLNHTSSSILGAIALAAVIFLFIGWWRTNDFAAEWGLLLATGVWLSRAVYIAITENNLLVLGTLASVVLSLSWAIGAGGAYLLERYDHVVGGELE